MFLSILYLKKIIIKKKKEKKKVQEFLGNVLIMNLIVKSVWLSIAFFVGIWEETPWPVIAILLGHKVPLVISRYLKEAVMNQMSCVERISTHSSYGSFAVSFFFY